jgi:hypothetical protein
MCSMKSDMVRLNYRENLCRTKPYICRIVSRGKLDSKASDFGGLEVFGGASIGHTDPFVLHEQIQNMLRASMEHELLDIPPLQSL